MQTASLINHLYANSNGPAPEVGMGATICMWTDRHAATVVAVSASGKSVVVQQDIATRADDLGMSDAQSYSYAPNPNAPEQTFTLRRNGRWVARGNDSKTGLALRLGVRDEHYDYSF